MCGTKAFLFLSLFYFLANLRCLCPSASEEERGERGDRVSDPPLLSANTAPGEICCDLEIFALGALPIGLPMQLGTAMTKEVQRAVQI